jgi:outer membrane protein TolC
MDPNADARADPMIRKQRQWTGKKRSPAVIAVILGAGVAVAAAGPETVETAPPAAPAREITARFHVPDEQARRLIETLLAENPGTSSAWSRSRSDLERVDQARSLPDPRLGYTYFASPPETRVGPQDHKLELSQSVPWGGKRRLQAERAASLAAGASWEAEDLERRLVAQLKRAYFEAAYLQEALTVNEEEQELLRRFERIALTRYSTGEGIQQSVVRVQTEISRLDDRRSDLQERLEAVERRLSGLVGRPEQTLVLGPIELALPEARHDLDRLEQAAVSEHPRVQAVEQRVEADRLWAERRELESRPDFRFGLGYILVDERDDLAGVLNPPEDNGKDVLALTVGINIPLHRKRIRAGVAEARESGRANEELLEAVRDRLRVDVQEAMLRTDSLDERARLYREVIIPQANESLASAEAAYTTNRLGFLDLLDAQRVLFQSRLAYHRLVTDLWIALTDLELAAGKPLPGEEAPLVQNQEIDRTSGSSS